jgi:hypothetical protein
LFQDKLDQKCSQVSKALEQLGISSEVFLVDWVFTAFTRTFNIKLTRVFWDLFLIFGDYYLIRLAYAVFFLLKKDLSNRENMEDGLKFIRNRTSNLKLSQLVKVALRENKSPADVSKLIRDKREKEEKKQQLQAAFANHN